MPRLNLSDLNRPALCEKCEGIMVFRGLGQYKCEDCNHIDHDDYGKARNYIEEQPGANVYQIAEATGVSRKSLTNMVRDGRFEITKDSKTFMVCDVCGVNIRSGRVCQKCEASYHKAYEEDVRRSNIKGGFGKGEKGDEGVKRFKRE